ncbi:MAG: cobalt ECF transporter T component CbiQ [Candidatus Omnitrophica bacterium]|nr:cobalt ECF transporter T component CbiQ [Candidatus Omnitrophota bacterium]
MDRGNYDIGYMDSLAGGNSPLHRLDPRAKLITTLFFIVTVVSFGKYTVLAFIPFFIYPVYLISAGGLPAKFILKKVLLVSPFAILLGIFNPVIDRETMVHIGEICVSGGWISFVSIILRFILTVTAALLLVALSGFNAVCEALTKLRVPRPFVVQLLFFYRYLFVLAEESNRMERARKTRTFHRGAMGFRAFVSLIGHLLLRTLDRSERIYRAMCSRGFDGHIRVSTAIKSGIIDHSFVVVWSILFIFFRVYNIPVELGEFIMEVF